MHNRLVIVGAGGHGRVIADIAMKNGYTGICFLDDTASGECMGLPIIGKICDIEKLNDGKTDFVIGVGDNATRQAIAEEHDVSWVALIHPSAEIGACATIGAGTVVMAGVVVNVCASIGRHCILNSNAVVEHDNVLEDYVHISPGVSLGGTVFVGAGTHVGIGVTVKNNVSICKNCTIGAGAVVVNNIAESAVYIGIPAKKWKAGGG